MQTVNLDELVGLRVTAMDGRRVGRISALLAEDRGGDCVIAAVRIETHGFASRVMRWMAMALSPASLRKRLAQKPLDVAWDKLDWANMRQPRLREQAR
jgi:sporulation protein YlmC with PRC-barrel domain